MCFRNGRHAIGSLFEPLQFLFQHLHGPADAQEGVADGVGFGFEFGEAFLALFKLCFEFLEAGFELLVHGCVLLVLKCQSCH